MADFFDEPAPMPTSSSPSIASPTTLPASLDVNAALASDPQATQDKLIAEYQVDLKTRGVTLVQAAEATTAKRTAESDAAAQEGAKKMHVAGDALLASHSAKRKETMAATAATHRQEQAADEAAKADMQQGGELWTCVNAVVDVTKPNKHCQKNTETMRRLLGHLKATPNVTRE
jgi:hypothetical protein